MSEELDNQGLFRKGIRYQGVSRGPVKRDEETGRLVPKEWFAPSKGACWGIGIGVGLWLSAALALFIYGVKR